MQSEGGSRERRASPSSRTSKRPLCSGGYRKGKIGSHPDRPHSGDREMTHISRKRSRSPEVIPRGPIHMKVHSPVHHSRDARSGDLQVKERGKAWEWDRGNSCMNVRKRGRQVVNDLNGVHPSRKGELPDRHRSVGPCTDAVSSVPIDDIRRRETWTTTSSKTDDGITKSFRDELAAARIAHDQAKEERSVSWPTRNKLRRPTHRSTFYFGNEAS